MAKAAHPQVAGFVVREATPLVSNCRAKTELPSWLAEAGIPAIEGLDTRALVRRLRESGAMRGAISNDPAETPASLLAAARAAPDMSGANLAESAGPEAPHHPGEDLGGWWDGARDMPLDRVRGSDRPYRVVALDCGANAPSTSIWSTGAVRSMPCRPTARLLKSVPCSLRAFSSAMAPVTRQRWNRPSRPSKRWRGGPNLRYLLGTPAVESRSGGRNDQNEVWSPRSKSARSCRWPRSDRDYEPKSRFLRRSSLSGGCGMLHHPPARQ